jgi:hypothetical protein
VKACGVVTAASAKRNPVFSREISRSHVPLDPDGLRRALARVQRARAGIIQARRKMRRSFLQGRFGPVAMDEAHRAAALRAVAVCRGEQGPNAESPVRQFFVLKVAIRQLRIKFCCAAQ